jgi:hypothetical protein
MATTVRYRAPARPEELTEELTELRLLVELAGLLVGGMVSAADRLLRSHLSRLAGVRHDW